MPGGSEREPALEQHAWSSSEAKATRVLSRGSLALGSDSALCLWVHQGSAVATTFASEG